MFRSIFGMIFLGQDFTGSKVGVKEGWVWERTTRQDCGHPTGIAQHVGTLSWMNFLWKHNGESLVFMSFYIQITPVMEWRHHQTSNFLLSSCFLSLVCLKESDLHYLLRYSRPPDKKCPVLTIMLSSSLYRLLTKAHCLILWGWRNDASSSEQ